MKESVYGWYPSARDVYRNAQRYHNNPYQLECLYKYQNSKYHSGPVTPSLQTFSIGLKTPPGHDGQRVPSPPKGRHHQNFNRQRQDVDLNKGSPCLVIKPAPRVKPVPIPTLSEVWATPTNTDATPITFTPAASYPKRVRYKSSRSVSSPGGKQDRESSVKYMETWSDLDPSNANIDWPALSRDNIVAPQHHEYIGYRVKSAPAGKRYGVRFAPARPVHSAKPSVRAKLLITGMDLPARPHTCPATSSKPLNEVPKRNTLSASAILQRSERTELCPEIKGFTDSRPDNPTPNLADLSLDNRDDLDVSEDEASSKDEYEDALEKYGWRAEVHGDPYGLKKLKPRLSYTVTCEEPVIPPEPPVGHMENWQTFFLNTIPRRPMAYTVHKEWVSEVIHAKRMELQKKQGVNFNFKKYAFAY